MKGSLSRLKAKLQKTPFEGRISPRAEDNIANLKRQRSFRDEETKRAYRAGNYFGGGAAFIGNIIRNPDFRTGVTQIIAAATAVGMLNEARAFSKWRNEVREATKEVRTGLAEEAKQNEPLRRFLGEHRYVIINGSGRIVGTDAQRPLGIGYIRLETGHILGTHVPLERTVGRVVKKKWIQKLQGLKARGRPSKRELEAEIRKRVLASGIVERLGVNLDDLSSWKSMPARDIRTWNEFMESTRAQTAKEKSIQWALRQMRIRENQNKARKALDQIIERRWLKDAQGVSHVIKRDRVLINAFNDLDTLLGKRRSRQLIRLFSKKLTRSLLALPFTTPSQNTQ